MRETSVTESTCVHTIPHVWISEVVGSDKKKFISQKHIVSTKNPSYETNNNHVDEN